MKRSIRLLFTIVVCGSLILSTTGCWNRRELDTLGILLGIGIDKAGDTGKVRLTAQIVKVGELKSPEQNSGSGEGKSSLNIESSGDTIFEAVRGFTHESSRKVYFPHNQIIIFGRDVASEGVRKYVDFFVRDPETRLNVFVLVSKAAAKEPFGVKPQFEKTSAMDIASLLQNQAATSQTSVIKMKDFLACLLSKTTSPVAPIVEVVEQGDKQSVYISGTAVFKKDKLVGELGKDETRGLLWVNDKVKSGIIKVKCPSGPENVSLEIIHAGSKVTPEIKDKKVYFKIKVKEKGNIGDQECFEDLALPSAMQALEKEEAEVIRGEIMSAFKKAKELNADIFGFGEMLHQRYPKQWKSMEKDWDDIFQTIELQVSVETRLELTGQINRPVSPE